ncbi:MAG: OsmC family protein [Cryobacterium sp.]|nr:OsmC family protein [Oligoflexia bacterium]
MVKYPLTFSVNSEVTPGIASSWSTSVPTLTTPLTVAVPPEFEGPGGGYSPEDFYAIALLNCFAATFKVIADRSKLSYESLSLSGTLTVDRGAGGAPVMKAFLLDGKLKGTGDRDRALRLLEKTSQSCLILNSVSTEKTFQFDVTE